MTEPYEVVIEATQSYAVIVLADDHDGAIAMAVAESIGRMPVIEMTADLEQLGRQTRATSYRKLEPGDPRRPPTIRN